MKGIMLKDMENLKYKTIKNVVSGRTTKERASVLLDLSIRQINGLVKVYKENGKEGFIHRNRNRVSPRKTSIEVENKIINLYVEDYYDFSVSHFQEVLNGTYNIAIFYPTLKRVLEDNGYISNYAHKKTKKIFKKKLNAQKKNKELSDVKITKLNSIVDFKDARPRRSKPKYTGEVIEMDACDHLWFGDEKCHLHGAIDVSTGIITGLYFSFEETLDSYYHVSKQMFLQYGIPAKIKTDKRTIFEYTHSKNKDIEKDTFTQFGYMCKSLDIDLTCSSVLESKPHIERLWGTLQKRLIPLLRQAKISCIAEANTYLQQYIRTYNSQFSVQDNNITSVYTMDNEILESIDKYLSIISYRVIDKGHCIKLNNKYYCLKFDGKQEFVAPKLKVLIIKDFNGALYSSIDGIDKAFPSLICKNRYASVGSMQ